MTDPVHEYQAFTKRHPDAHPLGGLMWSLMRGIAECDACPGVYRVPLDDGWKVLCCPHCHTISKYDGVSDEELAQIIEGYKAKCAQVQS